MSDINSLIGRLIQFALQQGLIEQEDVTFSVNRILAVLREDEYEECEIDRGERLDSAEPILEELLDYAAQKGLIESNTPVYRDLFDTEIMTCLVPRPSEIISKFNSLYHDDKKSATDYYYQLSKASNYIRSLRVKKDLMWRSSTKYGDIIITINLSKPEKDPKAIAAAKNMPAASYPKCLLCKENEGFIGNVSKPARGNHRVIPLHLKDELWYLQYSPYVYYNEHCIFFKGEHAPMAVSRKSFERLLEIVTLLPHYFVGSNADLPIVGGSILSHDHFQGGCADFPMAQAGISQEVLFKGFEDIEAGIVEWPMSVIRIKGTEKERLVALADKILTLWRGYSDEKVDILAFSDGEPHNTITPICRFRDGKYELDLVLRNNRTDERHPLGIFHPHEMYHHIKKENIGLIEVMGLAILPARLKEELKKIEFYLLNQDKEDELFADEALRVHGDWYRELKLKNPTPENVTNLVEQSVGEIFSEILENAGVYKRDDRGIKAFNRFIAHCNEV